MWCHLVPEDRLKSRSTKTLGKPKALEKKRYFTNQAGEQSFGVPGFVLCVYNKAPSTPQLHYSKCCLNQNAGIPQLAMLTLSPHLNGAAGIRICILTRQVMRTLELEKPC